jgi:DnaJ-class molecular chaperone
MGTVLLIAFLLVLLVFIGRRLSSIFQALKNKKMDAKNQSEMSKERQNQANAAQAIIESQRKEKVEDLKYARIINCPYCLGTGRAIIRREWRKAKDDGYMEYSIGRPDAYKRYLENPNEESNLNYVWDCDYRESSCPYCKRQGIAFAWYEQMQAYSRVCGNCNGTGKVIERVKLDIGMGDIQVDCQSCKSTGRISIPEKEMVHVKTMAKLKQAGDQYGGWEDNSPGYLDVEINDNNRDFYSKSKPRFESK